MGSSSDTSNKTSYETKTYDLSGLGDGGQAIAGEGNEVSFVDQGAVEAGKQVAIKGLDTGGRVSSNALKANKQVSTNALKANRDVIAEATGLGKNALARMKETAAGAMQSAEDSNTGAGEEIGGDMVKYGAIAAAAIGVALALRSS